MCGIFFPLVLFLAISTKDFLTSEQSFAVIPNQGTSLSQVPAAEASNTKCSGEMQVCHPKHILSDMITS